MGVRPLTPERERVTVPVESPLRARPAGTLKEPTRTPRCGLPFHTSSATGLVNVLPRLRTVTLTRACAGEGPAVKRMLEDDTARSASTRTSSGAVETLLVLSNSGWSRSASMSASMVYPPASPAVLSVTGSSTDWPGCRGGSQASARMTAAPPPVGLAVNRTDTVGAGAPEAFLTSTVAVTELPCVTCPALSCSSVRPEMASLRITQSGAPPLSARSASAVARTVPQLPSIRCAARRYERARPVAIETSASPDSSANTASAVAAGSLLKSPPAACKDSRQPSSRWRVTPIPGEKAPGRSASSASAVNSAEASLSAQARQPAEFTSLESRSARAASNVGWVSSVHESIHASSAAKPGPWLVAIGTANAKAEPRIAKARRSASSLSGPAAVVPSEASANCASASVSRPSAR